MADPLAWLIVSGVAGLLLAGVVRQAVPVGRLGTLLDALGLVPQWRFFAQSDIAGNASRFADPHLLVRVASEGGTISAWQPVFWQDDRKLVASLWNPHRRRSEQVLEFLNVLCAADRGTDPAKRADTIPYLAVLRLCLEARPLANGESLQFAVATTLGRDLRDPEPRFLSGWHRP